MGFGGFVYFGGRDSAKVSGVLEPFTCWKLISKVTLGKAVVVLLT